jgi:hypothetical protein
MTTPLAHAINARRKDALAHLETRNACPHVAIARQISRVGFGDAQAEAKQKGGEAVRFIVDGSAGDGFNETNGAEEKLLASGWSPYGPPVSCRSTGVKVKIYRKGIGQCTF